MSAPKVDDYRGWKAELAGQPRGLAKGEVSCGFYSTRAAGGTRTPIAIWRDDDVGLVYLMGDADEEQLVDADFAEKVFARAKAIPEGTYKRVMAGEGWPEDVGKAAPASPAPPAAGHEPDRIVLPADASHLDQRNSEPDPHELIQDQIRELQREQAKWLESIGGKVSTDEHYAKVIAFRDVFLKLKQDADKARAAEKKPHLDRGRDVDTRWKPVVVAAQDAKKAVEKLPQAYLREKQRIEDEARAAAQAAAALEAAAQERKPVREKSVTAAPQGGRGIKIENPDKAVIDDYAAALVHFSKNQKFLDNQFVRQAVQGFAAFHLRQGDVVPGARLVHLDEIEQPA